MSDLMLVGATGLVGGSVIHRFGAHSLTSLGRRAIEGLAKEHAQVVAPPGQWPEAIAAAAPAVLINCLGTTIKQAGSQAAFRAVDHDLVLAVAKAAKAAGARRFISISSVGASARSSNFYLKTKGETEAALRDLGFDRLDILRPGLLTGDRQGAPRLGESLAMLAAPFTNALLHGGLRRYRSIDADSVAKAIVALTRIGGTGAYVHENDAMRRLAD